MAQGKSIQGEQTSLHLEKLSWEDLRAAWVEVEARPGE